MSETIFITGDTSKDALHSALEAAQKGDRIIYWQGPHCGGLHRTAAAKAHDDGLCILVCKKVGDGMFDYMAVKK